MPGRLRVGVIYPGGGAEQEYYQFAEAHKAMTVYLVVSRTTGSRYGHTVEELLETGRVDYLVEAAKRLVPLHPDVAVWACTSSSFIVRRLGAEAQVRAIADVLEVPTSSTSLAFAHALDQIGAKRVAIAATYPSDAANAFKEFLEEFQIRTVNSGNVGAEDAIAASEVSNEQMIELARKVDVPDAEALLIPDTALPSLGLIEPLEKTLRKPVLTANQVTLWEAMRLNGDKKNITGFGRLFSTTL